MSEIEIINHIHFEIYDYAHKNGINNFSYEQKQLYYYIDFTIYVANGGVSGFLFNKSPSSSAENEYLPYIESFRFFNFFNLSDLIDLYQKKFIIVLKKYERNKQLIFNELYIDAGLEDLVDKIEKEVNTTKMDEYIESWIFENKIDLLKGIDKQQNIASLKIINLITEDEVFYQIPLNGTVQIEAALETWSEDFFLYQINEVGLIFSEIYIHIAHKNDFLLLDDFMNYIRFNENKNLTIKLLHEYPNKKGENLSKKEFQEELNLYLNEIFLNNEKSLLNLNFDKYQEGYFYFKEPSINVLGCSFEESYFGFSYHPYI